MRKKDMEKTKILVYGAGPLGSLFAARLQEGGNDVSLLSRGKRLDDLRQHGIVLKDFYTKKETVTRVNIIEALAPEDAYDLVLVIMRKNQRCWAGGTYSGIGQRTGVGWLSRFGGILRRASHPLHLRNRGGQSPDPLW
jgi:choline dehydrogenase-like flavoprotein